MLRQYYSSLWPSGQIMGPNAYRRVMYQSRNVCVVVPAYNEEVLVQRVIETMPDFVDRIIVVDDASTDDTFRVASESTDPRVLVLHHEQNQGVGGAIISGHKKALELGADISVVMAGDAQMDPKYLPDLLNPIVRDGYDFTKGNRFFSRNSRGRMPVARVTGNVALSVFSKIATGYWHVFDALNGYTAATRSTLQAVDLDTLNKGYAFESDLLIRLNMHNCKVKDVPMPAVYGSERSDIKACRAVTSILLVLFVGFWRRLFHKHIRPNVSASVSE